MTTVYKLTDQNMQTYNGYQWVPGETRTTDGTGGLCGPGWLHAYTDPLLAVLLNPIHANIKTPRLFRCTASGEMRNDKGLKVGYTSLTLDEELPLPEISMTHHIAFGILCSLEVHHTPGYVKWANAWLDGTDRTKRSAIKAAMTAEVAMTAEAVMAARAARAAMAANAAMAAEAAEAARSAADIDLIALAHKALDVKP